MQKEWDATTAVSNGDRVKFEEYNPQPELIR